jgi:hypothetical protein
MNVRGNWRRYSGVAATAVALMTVAVAAGRAAVVTLDFEGLQDNEAVLNYYNGGLGGNGSGPGPAYGVTFSDNALAVIDADAGGTGNFGGEPSPSTGLFFRQGASAILNDAAGFDTGFSFYYAAIVELGSITVFDGPNGTGSVLANLALPLTPVNGAPDPTGQFSPLLPIGVGFSGTARSVSFAGAVNGILFDNITFGSDSPVPTVVPEPGTLALLGMGVIGIISRRKTHCA